MITARIFGRTRLVATVLVLLGAVACACLGRWQLDRLAQRRAFNQRVASVRALPALDIKNVENLRGQEYRAAQAVGEYDSAREIAIRNQAYNGEYGFHLVTPLLLRDKIVSNPGPRMALLVDRGWIPADEAAQRGDWREYEVPGIVVVRGVIRLGQSLPATTSSPDPGIEPADGPIAFWVYVDIGRIARQLPYPVGSVYLQLAPGMGSANLPTASQPNLDLSEGPHQGYAVQWFGFAVILIVGYPLYVSKEDRRTS